MGTISYYIILYYTILYYIKEAPPHSAGPGQGLGLGGPGARGPGKSPGVLILVDFGVVWGPFWAILPSFWKVWETQRLFWRSQSQREGVRKGEGRPRVGSGLAGEPILVPTWAQHGPTWGSKIGEKTIKT